MCTRLVYLGPNGNIITGRSMDWKLEMATNLWALPRGTKVRKLDLDRDESNTFAGEISSNFETSEPFTFLGVTA